MPGRLATAEVPAVPLVRPTRSVADRGATRDCTDLIALPGGLTLTVYLRGETVVQCRLEGSYRMQIRTKMLLAFVSLALLPLATTSLVAYTQARHTLIEHAWQHLYSVATIQKHRIDSVLQSQQQRLDLVVHRLALRRLLAQFLHDPRPDYQEQMRQILQDAQASNADFRTMALYTPEARLVTATAPVRLAASDLAALWGPEQASAPRVFLDADAQVSMVLAAPMYLDNILLGQLLIEVDTASLVEIVGDYAGLGASGETILAQRDAEGHARFLTPTRFDAHAALRRTIAKQHRQYAMIQALQHPEQRPVAAVDYRGVPILAATAHLPAPDWGLVVKIDSAEVFAPVVRLGHLVCLIFGLTCLGVMTSAYLLTRHITRPILRLTRMAEGIEHGDLTQRLDATSGDEIGVLACTLQRMTDDLITARDTLEHRVQERTAALEREITERKQAEQAAHESAELLKGQNQVLERIAQGALLQEVLDVLLRIIEAQCPGMLCSILLLDADGVHVRHGAAPSLPESFTRALDGEPIGPRAGSCGTAAFRRAPVIVEDIATDALWSAYRDCALKHGLRACWSTPIFDEQRRVLGTFALYFRTPGHPTTRHWELIEMATYTAAIAIVKHQETEALRTSEERLRLAVTGGNIGIWQWDVGPNRLVWSDQLKAVFGWPTEAEDLTLQTFMDAIHPEDRLRIDAALQRSLAQRANYDVEYRIVWPDGSLHWIAAKGRGEYDTAGKPVRMLGVGLDITDQKRAEEEINRREAQLAEAQRIAQLGSYEWDIRRNTVYRSEELCRIFGLLPHQFEPTFEGYLDRVHPEDRSSTRDIIEQAFRERKPFDFEERIVRADGAIRLLRSQGQWIVDKAQNPVKLVGICQDITERKQAEDQLRRSEERFQIVARATNDAIWDWDLGTNVVWWNQGITMLSKYSAEEVGIDTGWRWDHVHPEDLERVVSGIRAVMHRGEQFWSGEYRFRRADGSYADIFDRGFVLYDSTRKPIRMLGAMADISERKRALEILEQRVASRTAELRAKNRELEHEISRRQRVEELLRARNDELKAFAYTVSHDLKAPLRGIAGYAQELDRRHRAGLGERALFCLQQILTATHNLDRLIEDLLYYSRLDAETPTAAEINLAHMVEAILKDRQPVLLEQSAEVVVSLSSPSIRTWERGLLQVLTNLIDNALKYSRDARPPCIHITSQEFSDALRIMISDNGIGFDMKYHDRIFGLFNRLVRQEEFEGTGAGLAIVKKVLEKLGGKIWAESKPGSGAQFFVELPQRPGRSDRGMT